MEIERVTIPQLSIEQKFAVREAQYKILRAEQNLHETSQNLLKVIKEIGETLKVDPQMIFNLDVLQFIPQIKSPTP